MDDLTHFLHGIAQIKEFERVYIQLASPAKIRSWSYGEIKTPETINYRSLKPEHKGLFCAQIFGPIKSYECLCGKHKHHKPVGIVCEKCGVEIISNQARRERMGHIELATPVAHIWYLKYLPSRIGLLLDMPLRDLEKILYYEAYVVIDPKNTALKLKQLLSVDAYLEAVEEYGNEFEARMGGEAIHELLRMLDLATLELQLQEQIANTQSVTLQKRLSKRLHFIQYFLQSGNRPEWMILTVLPVLPPALRPLVAIDNWQLTSSDLNELYRQIITRNNRIKRLLEVKAPEMILHNEQRMLQQAIDALLDNGHQTKTVLGANKLPLQSLSNTIKGKQGRFRQHLLKKRVDYSGRAVIIADPTLGIHQCGIPKEMALELFKPFLLHALLQQNLASNIVIAKKMIAQRQSVIWNVLAKVIQQHPLLLNRQPTLYRLSIQAFEPILVEGKAIQISPLASQAFNAGFSGDQMAIHIPLSLEAQLEARVLMMASNNLLSPSHGEPIVAPSREVLIGLHLLTRATDGVLGEKMVFADLNEVQRAYYNGFVALSARIEVRISQSVGTSTSPFQSNHQLLTTKRIKTTVGRTLIFESLPAGFPIEKVNCCLTQATLSELILYCYNHFGITATLKWIEQLMILGFTYATRASISLGMTDLLKPNHAKNQNEPINALISEAKMAIERVQSLFHGSMIPEQRHHKIIDIWTLYIEKINQAIISQLSNYPKPKRYGSSNALDVNTDNILQLMLSLNICGIEPLRQIMGMRGLITNLKGTILEMPVTTNFRDGLDMFEYFLSSYGSRKGMVDTALKTARTGYLTRRLIDAVQDVIVTELDCGTHDGITITSLNQQQEATIETLKERILGRVIAEDIEQSTIQNGKHKKHHKNLKKVIIPANTLIGEKECSLIEQLGINTIKIRSPITCQAQQGICAQCYGVDLGRGERVHIGETIGIAAALSIGEAGTQLMLRNRKIGGVTTKTVTVNHFETKMAGQVKFHHLKLLPLTLFSNHFSTSNPKGKKTKTQKVKKLQSSSSETNKSVPPKYIAISHAGEISIIDKLGVEQQRAEVPYGALISIEEGQWVQAGQIIAHWDPHTYPLISQVSGYVRFVDLIEGITIEHQLDEFTGQKILIVADPRLHPIQTQIWRPMIKIVEQKNKDITLDSSSAAYWLPPHAIIHVAYGAKVNAGDLIAQLPYPPPQNPDIVGQFPRILELFEARSPKKPAILAQRDGTVTFLYKGYKNKYYLKITDSNGDKEEYSFPLGQLVRVFDGQTVNRGDVIVEGEPDPHELLRLKGVHAVVHYMLKEIQTIYRSQGIKINDKHLEVILCQMLHTATIIDPGDTSFSAGMQVNYKQLHQEHQLLNKMEENSKKEIKLATWQPQLRSITQVSLETSSFISAASFRDTIRALLTSSIKGQRDELRGPKENIILGRLIPAGTGFKQDK